MPVYSFRNTKTKEVYDLILSYDEMLKHKKKRNVEYILSAPKIFRLNDMGGPEDQFREWVKQDPDDIDVNKSHNFRQSKKEYLYGDKEDK
tara:strand:+ start:343 stop:612 length:270 start_codon:yes stop_codon:yes gene_type:complete